jgi:glutamate formiminotransferase
MTVEGCVLADVRSIAAMLRETGGGLPGVRAIGLDLGDGGLQLSTNVHDPIGVPLARVVAEASELGLAYGARITAAEVVGLVPRAALAGFPAEIPLVGFDPASGVIENGVGGDGKLRPPAPGG